MIADGISIRVQEPLARRREHAPRPADQTPEEPGGPKSFNVRPPDMPETYSTGVIVLSTKRTMM